MVIRYRDRFESLDRTDLYTLAQNLKGKLFLAHGDVDENLPLAVTVKPVDALVNANENFDLLIMPNHLLCVGFHP